jgi:hypothetical protein
MSFFHPTGKTKIDTCPLCQREVLFEEHNVLYRSASYTWSPVNHDAPCGAPCHFGCSQLDVHLQHGALDLPCPKCNFFQPSYERNPLMLVHPHGKERITIYIYHVGARKYFNGAHYRVDREIAHDGQWRALAPEYFETVPLEMLLVGLQKRWNWIGNLTF